MAEELKPETLEVLIEDGVATVLRDPGGPARGPREGLIDRVRERLGLLTADQVSTHLELVEVGAHSIGFMARTPTGRGILEGWDSVGLDDED